MKDHQEKRKTQREMKKVKEMKGTTLKTKEDRKKSPTRYTQKKVDEMRAYYEDKLKEKDKEIKSLSKDKEFFYTRAKEHELNAKRMSSNITRYNSLPWFKRLFKKVIL